MMERARSRSPPMTNPGSQIISLRNPTLPSRRGAPPDRGVRSEASRGVRIPPPTGVYRRPNQESRLRSDDKPGGNTYHDNVDGYQGYPGYEPGYPRSKPRNTYPPREVSYPTVRLYQGEEQLEEYDYNSYMSPDEEFDVEPFSPSGGDGFRHTRPIFRNVEVKPPQNGRGGFHSYEPVFGSAAPTTQGRIGGFQSRGKFDMNYPDDRMQFPGMGHYEDGTMMEEDWRSTAKPGDWTCTQCMFSNFATRTQCYKCKAERGNAPETLSLVNWECTDCFASNHEKRFECFKCKKAKPRNAKECSRLVDWACPACSYTNAARRTNCSRCDGARPGRKKELEANPDWRCGGCGIMNWSWRESCYKCQGSKENGKIPSEAENTNWYCAGCGKNNWARREQCFSCKLGKDGQPVPEDKQEWECSKCGQNNWTHRTQCFSCKADK